VLVAKDQDHLSLSRNHKGTVKSQFSFPISSLVISKKGAGWFSILGYLVLISEVRSVGKMINVVSAWTMHRMTANDIVNFQMGTHPALTSSPIVFPIDNAADNVLSIRN